MATRKRKWKPTEKELKEVEALAGYGLPNDTIADFFGIHRNTFETMFKSNTALRYAVTNGIAKAKANVTKTAYEMAMSKKHPAMTIFYLKTRLRWSEKTIIEHHTPQTNEQAQAQMTQAVEDFKTLLAEFKRLPTTQQPDSMRGLLSSNTDPVEILKAEIVS